MKDSIVKRRNWSPWPWAIVGWFLIFASGIAVWVTYAVRQNMDLVRKDYYEEEIRYQRQIDRRIRAQLFRNEISVTYDAAHQTVAIALPAIHAREAKGSIFFYRPSDAKLDRTVTLHLEEGRERIDVRDFQQGLWNVRLEWNVGDQSYSFEQPIVLAAPGQS